MTEWISVKDRLPDEEVNVLIFNGYIKKTCLLNGEWLLNSKLQQEKTTHWMPLPEPPKE